MVTIIIPTYNEENNIKRIEAQLKKLSGNFEVIFTDGYSSDNTFDMITFFKIQEAKYRSNQMNSAIKYSNGDYLWFLHSDSKINLNAINSIEKSKADWGCFRLRFASNKLIYFFISAFSNLRVKTRKIAFGDQGIFIKKSLFIKIGKYDKIPIMEDYDLSIRLKKLNIPPVILKEKIYTSPRRFEKNGIIKTIIMMQKLQFKFRNGGNIYKIYKEYK